MPFQVVVEGAKYRVDAPDENTAWAWANAIHLQQKLKVSPEAQEGRNVEALNLQAGNAPNGGPPQPTNGSVPSVPLPADAPQPAAQPAPAPAPGDPNLNTSANPPLNMGTKLDQFVGGLPDIQSSVPGRMIRGAADLPVGAMQLLLNVLGQGDKVNPKLNDTFAKSAPPDGGFDIARLGGNLLSPGGWAGARLLKGASALEKAGLSANIGGILGLLAPVAEKNYGESKLEQVAGGETLGGVLSPVLSGVGRLASGIGDRAMQTANLVLPGGAERIKNAYLKRIVGEQNIPAVQERLKANNELVPGSKPTAGQVLSDLPEGSPLVAQERITARTPGGPSADFGNRWGEQVKARATALEERDAVTTKLRDSALARANEGKISLQSLTEGLEKVTNAPEMMANPVVRRTLRDVLSNLGRTVSPDGAVDAKGLYTVRGLITDFIEKHSRQGGQLRGAAAGLEMDMKKVIDSAIEDAELRVINKARGGPPGGGTGEGPGTNVVPFRGKVQDRPQLSAGGPPARQEPNATIKGDYTVSTDTEKVPMQQPEWRKYLEEFSKRTGAVEKDEARAAAKPIQKTDLQGGVNIADEARAHLPNMLSRPATWANAIMRFVSGRRGIEPVVDEKMAQDFLDPQKLSRALDGIPVSKRDAVIRNLIERGAMQGTLNQ